MFTFHANSSVRFKGAVVKVDNAQAIFVCLAKQASTV